MKRVKILISSCICDCFHVSFLLCDSWLNIFGRCPLDICDDIIITDVKTQINIFHNYSIIREHNTQINQLSIIIYYH